MYAENVRGRREKAASHQGRWRNGVFLLTALLVVVIDQLSKSWVRGYSEGYQIVEVRFFRLIHIQNTGAAFGLFRDQAFTLTIVALIGIGVLLLFALAFSRHFPFVDNWLCKISLGLLLGGTAGNLIDRIRSGHVTDFIDFGFWPAFNVADASIVIGVTIFVVSFLFPYEARKYCFKPEVYD